METVIASVIIITVLSGLFGFGLAYASKKLAVHKEERVEQIESALPGVNCGACGYPGCAGYAEAIVNDKVDISLCAPGGAEVSAAVAAIMGVKASTSVPVTARVHCGGNDLDTKQKLRYNGIEDCRSADAVSGGFLACPEGCLGLGSCVKVCKFDAISIDRYGRTVVIEEKCTGCGACVKACPRRLIELVPHTSTVVVECASHAKGAVCNKICAVSCIACMKCEKACEDDAIHVTDFLAVIDYAKCTSCGKCVAVCPKKCISNAALPARVQAG